MRRGVAAACGAALAVALVSGCSDDTDDAAAPSSTASSTASSTESVGVASTSPESGGANNLRGDCAGLTSADLTRIFGADFGNPTPSSGARSTVDDINYKTVGCSYETSDLAADDNTIEVDLALSFAEQFSDNRVQCIEPSDHIHPVTPVSGVGDQAWWQPEDFENSTDAEGELTVCVDEALISIQIEGPTELQATMPEQAIEIARIVVG